MRAYVPTGIPADLVVLADVDDPADEQAAAQPDRPADEHAVVQVGAYSINRGETFLLNAPRPGWRPGKDIAGTVVRAAADGSGPGVGSTVVGHPEQGGWAERVAVPTGSLAVVPDGIDPTVAAALPLAGLTALRLTRATGPLAGRRVLLTGASGGVGHYFVELAIAQGAEVTAVSRTSSRGSRLRALGADVVTDLSDAVGPYDVVIESVGGANVAEAWARLRRRGHLIWLGQAGNEPALLDFFDWSGATSGTLTRFDYTDSDRSVADDLTALLHLVAGGHLHPEIGLVADWSGTGAAIRSLLDRELVGNAVLTVPAK